eukprot:s2244_g2.t1
MFKGRSLVALAAVLASVTTVVIYLEWRAVQDIRSGFSSDLKDTLKKGLQKGRHALLQHMVFSEGRPWAQGFHFSKGGASLRGSGEATTRLPSLEVSGIRETELPEEATFTGTYPPFPTPREVRHPSCQREFALSELPRASLVIPYLNETWVQIKATVGSLLAHSPLELVDQILFIDDGNSPEWQHHDELRALHPKIRVHRNEVRQGLIRAKVIGAAMITSPVLIFMEPHCIVVQQWLEPLLEQLSLAEDHKTLVMPILDIIPEKNFDSYLPANHHIGGFDWSLTFGWKALIETRNKSYIYPNPYPTPALSGGIFALWKDNWEYMGTYDTNMTEWGGEHIEMSLRAWRCGGRIEIVPCSRMGHVFRAKNPYVVHVPEVMKNTKRAALVWLDEYLEDYYKKVPYARRIQAGDVSERLRVKESLHCHSMDWYIDNIYPELRAERP